MARGALVIGAILVLGGGCSSQAPGDGGSRGHSDCVAPLTWNGAPYWSAGEPERPLAVGRRLGRGSVRCPGEDAPPGREVTVLRIEGVPPSVAVAIQGEPYAWLAPGYVPESPRHPLHAAVYGGPEEPSADAGFGCGSSRTIRARALTTPAFDVIPLEVEAVDEQAQEFLRREDVDGIVTLDAHTVVTGFERDGIPFVQAGNEFWLILSECEGKATEPGLAGLRRLVVERLRP